MVLGRILPTVALLLLATAGFPEEFFKNMDFSEVSSQGIPSQWKLKPDDASRISLLKTESGNVLKLSVAERSSGKGIQIFQYSKDLDGLLDKELALSWEARGSANEYGVACEWTVKDQDGRSVFFDSPRPRGGIEAFKFKKFTSVFRVAKEAKSFLITAYLREPGAVEIKGLSLVQASTPECKGCEGGWRLEGNAVFKDKAVVVSAGGCAALTGISVKRGVKYRLEYTVSASGDASAESVYHQYRIAVECAGRKLVDAAKDVSGHQTHSLDFVAAGNSCAISIRAEKDAQIAFSDFSLEELKKSSDEDIKLTLSSPSFRATFYRSMPESAIAGEIVAPSQIDVAATLRLMDENGQELLQRQEARRVGRNLAFSLPAEALPDGKYILIADVTDVKTGRTLKQLRQDVFKVPPAREEILVRRDGQLYINGAKTFIIGMFDLEPRTDEAFAYAARNGVNAIIYYTPPAREGEVVKLLDSARKHGIRLMFGMKEMKDSSAKEFQVWKSNVERIFTPAVIGNPGFLGYYYEDEPQWRGTDVAAVKKGYEFLKQRDPYHPAFTCEAPRGTLDELKNYTGFCDISGVDIYPIPYPNSHSDMKDKTPSCVGKYTVKMREAVDGAKPVWLALQGFAWGDLTNHARPVYPSSAETRFMAFDAMLHGANAIFYWGCPYIKDPYFHETLFKTTSELRKLSALFSNGKELAGAVQSSDPAIFLRVYDCGDKKYILAINTESHCVKTRFQSPFKTLFELSQAQEIAVDKGAFNADFEPYAVHVYGETPDASLLAQKGNVEELKGVSPFYERLKHYSDATFYSGKAKWIWEKSLVQVKSSKAYFIREFHIDKEVANAKFHLAADDMANVFFNGQAQGCVKGHAFMKAFDIAKSIKKGGNVLYIEAEDAGALPCGILGELKVEYADGSVEIIETDESWKASPRPGRMNCPSVDGEWTAAQVVAPYGEGAWGKNTRMKP